MRRWSCGLGLCWAPQYPLGEQKSGAAAGQHWGLSSGCFQKEETRSGSAPVPTPGPSTARGSALEKHQMRTGHFRRSMLSPLPCKQQGGVKRGGGRRELKQSLQTRWGERERFLPSKLYPIGSPGFGASSLLYVTGSRHHVFYRPVVI